MAKHFASIIARLRGRILDFDWVSPAETKSSTTEMERYYCSYGAVIASSFREDTGPAEILLSPLLFLPPAILWESRSICFTRQW